MFGHDANDQSASIVQFPPQWSSGGNPSSANSSPPSGSSSLNGSRVSRTPVPGVGAPASVPNVATSPARPALSKSQSVAPRQGTSGNVKKYSLSSLERTPSLDADAPRQSSPSPSLSHSLSALASSINDTTTTSMQQSQPQTPTPTPMSARSPQPPSYQYMPHVLNANVATPLSPAASTSMPNIPLVGSVLRGSTSLSPPPVQQQQQITDNATFLAQSAAAALMANSVRHQRAYSASSSSPASPMLVSQTLPMTLTAYPRPGQQQQQSMTFYHSPGSSSSAGSSGVITPTYDHTALMQMYAIASSGASVGSDGTIFYPAPSPPPHAFMFGGYHQQASAQPSVEETLHRAHITCRTFSSHTDERDACVRKQLPYELLVGVDVLKHRILDSIERAVLRDDMHTGLLVDTERAFVVNAPLGTGVRTTVRAFCAHAHINLVEHDAGVPPSEEAHRALFTWMESHQPCVLLVHRLDRKWTSSERAGIVARLVTLWQASRANMPRAWVIFAQHCDAPEFFGSIGHFTKCVLPAQLGGANVALLLQRITEWQLALMHCSNTDSVIERLRPTFAKLAHDSHTLGVATDVHTLLQCAFNAQKNSMPIERYRTAISNDVAVTSDTLTTCYREMAVARRKLRDDAAAAAALMGTSISVPASASSIRVDAVADPTAAVAPQLVTIDESDNQPMQT